MQDTDMRLMFGVFFVLR